MSTERKKCTPARYVSPSTAIKMQHQTMFLWCGLTQQKCTLQTHKQKEHIEAWISSIRLDISVVLVRRSSLFCIDLQDTQKNNKKCHLRRILKQLNHYKA